MKQQVRPRNIPNESEAPHGIKPSMSICKYKSQAKMIPKFISTFQDKPSALSNINTDEFQKEQCTFCTFGNSKQHTLGDADDRQAPLGLASRLAPQNCSMIHTRQDIKLKQRQVKGEGSENKMQKLDLFRHQKDNMLPTNTKDRNKVSILKNRQSPTPNISEAPLTTPITENNAYSSTQNPKQLIMQNFYERNDYVWYAAYDEDMNSQHMLSKLVKINSGKAKDDIDILPMEI